MFLSLPVTGSIYESFPLSDMSHTGLFAFQVSCFSIFISMIMSAMHYIENFNKYVGGTPFELVMATTLLGLWMGAAIVIQDPENDIASTLLTDEGTEGIESVKEANLYTFTWLALFCNVYLVGSFFRDYRRVDLRVMSWVSLLAASLILLGISAYLKDGICDTNNDILCFRIKYGMGSSMIVGCISLIASVLSYASKVSPRLGLVLVSPTAAIYCFGVGLLTSKDGPGHAFGTIYFTIWFGAIISVLLLIGEFNEMFLNEIEVNETDSKTTVKIPMGNDKYNSPGDKNRKQIVSGSC